jgi:hypothetical protein
LSIGIYNNRHSGKLYRNKNRRRPYRKRWVRKKASDKKGFTRYSTGLKWSGQYFPENPAFWRTHQVNWTEKYRDKHELLSNGYSVHDNWIALCKSWNGFLIGKREDDYEKMMRYATQIRTLQKVLKLPLTEFNMFTPEEMIEIEQNSDLDSNESRYATTVP